VMTRKYLAFDIEIATEIPEGEPNWAAYRPLGISCAATFAGDASEPILWHGGRNADDPADRMSRDDAKRLLGHITAMASAGYTILTWNGLGFDFDVLAEEAGAVDECSRHALGHVDMMFHLFCTLGYGVALDRAARGMGLTGKPAGMTGAMVPGLWARGERRAVLDYVAQDARVSLELARECERCGVVRWIARSGKPMEVPLRSGWLTVREALELPLPDTSWMSNPWPRTKFTGWLSAR